MQQKINVLVWVHDFPAISETFIRNHIIGLLDRGCHVKVYAKHKRPKQKQALKGFEAYDLYSKCFSNEDLLEKNWMVRFMKAMGFLVSLLGKTGFWQQAKTLNVFKYGKASFQLQNFYLLKYIRENKIDIVHAHYGFMGNEAIFLKEIGLPMGLFTTFHGVDIRQGLKPENKGLYDTLFAHADRIISISNYNTQALETMGASQNKLVSLPNGIDTAYFSPTENTNEDGIHILSVGRFMDVKGYDIAIPAFNRVCEKYKEQSLTLHLVGDGPQRAELEALTEQWHLEDRIVFHGWQSSHAIKEHYQKADLYLLPSRNEALPTVLLEAQSCGLPIVATDVGSVRDMIPEGNVIVNPGNEEVLAKGLLKMLERKPQWEEIAIRNRNHVLTHYDANMILEKLLTLYKEYTTKG